MGAPLKRLVPVAAILGLSAAADADELPPDFFTADRGRVFGYTLGTSTGEARGPMPTRETLPGEFAPFTDVSLSWSQPSGTLYTIRGSGRIRNERACVEKLSELRTRFEAIHPISLREDSFRGSDGDRYFGYFGTHDSVNWNFGCDGRTLSVSAIDVTRENGCDPREQPAALESVTPAEWAERFPGFETSSTPEIRAIWQRIAIRAEGAYVRLRAGSPCLEGTIALSALLDSEGVVHAVEARSSGFADAALEQEVTELVRATAFPKNAAATWRRTTANLRFSLR